MKRAVAWAFVAPAIIFACTTRESLDFGELPDAALPGSDAGTPPPDAPAVEPDAAPRGVCGDGRLDEGEACDDGNNAPSDGCSAGCKLESSGPSDACPGVALALTANGSGQKGTATGTTATTYGQYSGSCGGGTGKDAVFVVTPEATGRLTANVKGAFDALIYARHSCDDARTELACKDNVGEAGSDQIKIAVTGGQPVYLFVDGFSGASGDFELDVELAPAFCGDGVAQLPEVCDDGNNVAGDGCAADCTLEAGGILKDCPGQSITLTGPPGAPRRISLTGSTSGQTSSTLVAQGCLGGAYNHVYSIASDVEGALTAKLVAGYDTGTIHIRTECDTADTQLDCIKAAQPFQPVELSVPIKPGLPLYVVVDGATAINSQAGPYTLDVVLTPAQCGNGVLEGGEQCDDGNAVAGDGCAADCSLEPIAAASDSCPGAPLPLTLGGDGKYSAAFTSSTAGFAADVKPKALAGGCTTLATTKDAVYLVTPPVSGRLSANVKGSFDTMLYARTSCSDASVSADLVCAGSIDGNRAESLSLPVTANTSLYIIVDSEVAAGAGPFLLSVEVAPAECGNGTLDGGEACDDGNFAAGDGCSASCAIEPATSHDTCSNAELLTLTAAAGGTFAASVSSGTTNLANDQTFPACASAGSDAIYKIVAPIDGVLTAAVPTAGFNVTLGARATCTGTMSSAPLVCANASSERGQEEIFFAVVQGQTYYVIVDGTAAGELGVFTMNLTLRPPGCGDGVLSAQEACDDGNQSNGDGCSSACAIEALPNIDTCPGYALPLVGAGTAPRIGSLTVDTSTLSPDYGGSCGGSSKEGVVVITSDIGGKLTARLTGQTYQPAMYLRGSCNDPTTERACTIDSSGGNSREIVVGGILANTPYYLFIDGYNGSAGVGRLNVTVTP